jgi:hypothetical protein
MTHDLAQVREREDEIVVERYHPQAALARGGQAPALPMLTERPRSVRV